MISRFPLEGRKDAAGLLCTLCVLAGAPLSHAAEGQASKADNTDALQKIVVTATRRTENVQDVPATIDVITGEQLAAMQARDYRDYLNSVPSVNYTDSGFVASRVVIRGISDGFAAIDPLTGIYVDEAPISETGIGLATFDPSLYDVERVEVLRGPQGTLYGSGSMGGIVRIGRPPSNIAIERFPSTAD